MAIRPELKTINWLNPIHFCSLGFGSGLAPKAPGTFGTLAALPLVYLMGTFLPFYAYLAITLVAAILGCYLCGQTAKALNAHDHPAIVWDEFVGLMITFIFIPVSTVNLLVGFCLFRFFDIIKPWPISFVDKKIHGGTGIMLDDIIAGLMALGCLHLYLHYF
ncbi:phosphatidylglycerophosphatase A [Saccharobesus litoralis]|uniref:Phosphatidylglycerophosphatase A n=1 Tax=Saccharobesus litoralis TaxID=2172099 RepID=A0A2S0VTR2_9ALTE|nr:phosphatidylglycerophosphatase A [Saccharobesus litoralis]AWB67597.1 phosphatidylglycerophosphatase A [Saccharobesus litoralis]